MRTRNRGGKRRGDQERKERRRQASRLMLALSSSPGLRRQLKSKAGLL